MHAALSAIQSGRLGSCTGNAMAGVLTDPCWAVGRLQNESDAMRLDSEAGYTSGQVSWKLPAGRHRKQRLEWGEGRKERGVIN